MQLIVIITLLSVANGFQTSFKPITSRGRIVTFSTPTNGNQEITDLNLEQMVEVFEAADTSIPAAVVTPTASVIAFDPKSVVGSSAPMGFFDPSGYTIDITAEQYKLYQEAEIKHGRVSMLAFLGLIFGETFHPLFNGEITGPAIYQFQQADAILPLYWVGVLWMIAMIEGQTIITAWQPLEETLKEPLGMAKLKPSHVAGDLNFDPLGFKPKDVKALNSLKVKELNNGRLAMIGVAGIVAQELVSGQSIF